EAVAMGMAIATAAATLTGVCPAADADRICRLLSLYDLPPAVSLRDLRAALGHVCAVRLIRGNQLHFVLPAGIGAVQIVPDVPDDVFMRAIEWMAAHPLTAKCVQT